MMKSAIQATRTCPQRSLRRRWVYAGLAGLAILCPAPAFPEPFDDLRQWIQAQLVRGDVPSLSVAVARDGQILWEEGFGWADRERQVRATPHTRYSLASISKPMTATGLMVLVEEGRVDLDRPVNEYLGHPALRVRVGSAHAATVRRVANHTAGLPLHHHFFIEGAPAPTADGRDHPSLRPHRVCAWRAISVLQPRLRCAGAPDCPRGLAVTIW